MTFAAVRTEPVAPPLARDDASPDEAERIWARIEPTLRGFKQLVAAVDRNAIRSGAVAPEQIAELERAFAGIERLLHAELDRGAHDPSTCATVGARVQAELLPLMLLGDNAERWYAKPRGYAGDYLSIDRMYDDVPRGHGRVGPAIDRCFLDLAAVRAVQNRRALVAAEITATVAASPGRARVTSLACGPARELFDVYAALPDPAKLASTLVDIDLHALAHVGDRRDRAGLKRHMSLVHENLVYLATGRARATFEEQDLVYSVGLVDYFEDAFVVKLLDFVYGTLRPGGRVVIGNFHPRNGSRAVMDHVLDWKLHHRTEEDMDRLFRESAFGRPCTLVVYEEQGINLFAECIRR